MQNPPFGGDQSRFVDMDALQRKVDAAVEPLIVGEKELEAYRRGFRGAMVIVIFSALMSAASCMKLLDAKPLALGGPTVAKKAGR